MSIGIGIAITAAAAASLVGGLVARYRWWKRRWGSEVYHIGRFEVNPGRLTFDELKAARAGIQRARYAILDASEEMGVKVEWSKILLVPDRGPPNGRRRAWPEVDSMFPWTKKHLYVTCEASEDIDYLLAHEAGHALSWQETGDVDPDPLEERYQTFADLCEKHVKELRGLG